MNQQIEKLTGSELSRRHFHEIENRFSQNGQAWFLNIRKAAFARFNELGIPSQREEDWKHTSLRPLLEVEFQQTEPDASTATNLLENIVFHGVKAHRAAYVDGRLSQEHSNL